MKRLDCNCFMGGWPFHRVRHGGLDDLRRLHGAYGIEGGFVSSSDAIFYNDPWEADALLAEALKGAAYRLVMTVNPTLPGWRDSVRRALASLGDGLAGVRILPGFHGYTLADGCAAELAELLRETGLPLFLTLRMEDERVTYMFHPRSVLPAEVAAFLKAQPGFPVLLCNIRSVEYRALRAESPLRPDVYADICGFKDGLFVIDDLYEEGKTDKLVYGSLAPVFCLASSAIFITESKIPEAEMERIFAAEGFLAAIAAARK